MIVFLFDTNRIIGELWEKFCQKKRQNFAWTLATDASLDLLIQPVSNHFLAEAGRPNLKWLNKVQLFYPLFLYFSISFHLKKQNKRDIYVKLFLRIFFWPHFLAEIVQVPNIFHFSSARVRQWNDLYQIKKWSKFIYIK